MSEQIPPIAAIVTHRVEDFDKWKTAFDANQSARKSAGILGHHLNRGADDPNLVAVYLPASDEAKLRAFFTDDDLRSVMKEAGVAGTPSIKVVKPRSVDVDFDAERASMIVVHPVESYGAWREAYDGFDARRQEMGITGHAVNVLSDDEQTVVVYHQAKDVKALEAFASSDELKNRMKDAGVSGPPDIAFWNSSPAVQY